MGYRLGGGSWPTTPQLTAAGLGALTGAGLTLLFAWSTGTFDDPKPPTPVQSQIDAAVVVDATVIEMHGYGPDGEPGVFTYDCQNEVGQPVAGVEPTLVCTQRENGDG